MASCYVRVLVELAFEGLMHCLMMLFACAGLYLCAEVCMLAGQSPSMARCLHTSFTSCRYQHAATRRAVRHS